MGILKAGMTHTEIAAHLREAVSNTARHETGRLVGEHPQAPAVHGTQPSSVPPAACCVIWTTWQRCGMAARARGRIAVSWLLGRRRCASCAMYGLRAAASTDTPPTPNTYTSSAATARFIYEHRR